MAKQSKAKLNSHFLNNLINLSKFGQIVKVDTHNDADKSDKYDV